ncbi:hypothetical protein ACFY19_20675 [Streptosporangium saharense]|uniref:hypothetical protein n=1 Tax=Streptosporangium saharense TaxID=1706840 RepID=UPI003694FBE7
MSITGGGAWMLQDERSDQDTYGGVVSTQVWAQVAPTDNPQSYAVTQDDEAAGLVTVLHLRGATPTGMLLVSDWVAEYHGEAIRAPSAPEGAAGGVEVRYVAASRWFDGGDIEWYPAGSYTVSDQGSAFLVSSYLGARGMLTSAPLGRTSFYPDGDVGGYQTWTLVIRAGDYVPPPPPEPAFTPAKGSALYRYTVHDFPGGGYLDDIYPQDPSYDKRIGEPGAFSGTLPIPNRRVAEAIRRFIPKTATDLSTGPGRIEVRIWRDGVLAGRYWITGAQIRRGRDGKISVQLRGTTLDAYFFSVRVRQDRSYSGDQVANVRSLLQHAQTQPGANIGLKFQTGSSGVSRPLEIQAEDGTTYGRAAQEYSKTSGGFEYVVNETVGVSGVESTWVWGYPKLGTGTKHVFTESPHGGEVAEWGIEIDALRGGTDWQVRGGTPEGDATEDRVPVYSVMKTTPHRAAGWPRLDRLIDHPNQATGQSTLDAFAEYWATSSGGAVWVRSVTVFLGKNPSLTMQKLGDFGRFVLSNVWFESEDGGAGLDVSERIIGIQIRPTAKGSGKEEATLILESEAIS